ncbi:hypothetical protein BN938_1817 [Mucinivorans hirudinis]|uniref:Uncharacterized protein n=1 Tax=Mucinivorans hirudinis TaxID=1433126 RepID=A0A060R8S6_9BACT|nr:hypothetical protein BN938_1817 [Mucinivorans hirudinis]
MKHLKDQIKSFDDRIVALRKEITEAIIDLLKSNKITVVTLAEEPDHLSYVVWFDDDGCGHDCVVQTVMLDGDSDFEIEAYSESVGYTLTLSSKDHDFSCTNVHWLSDILTSMNYTLTKEKNGN